MGKMIFESILEATDIYWWRWFTTEDYSPTPNYAVGFKVHVDETHTHNVVPQACQRSLLHPLERSSSTIMAVGRNV